MSHTFTTKCKYLVKITLIETKQFIIHNKLKTGSLLILFVTTQPPDMDF